MMSAVKARLKKLISVGGELPLPFAVMLDEEDAAETTVEVDDTEEVSVPGIEAIDRRRSLGFGTMLRLPSSMKTRAER